MPVVVMLMIFFILITIISDIIFRFRWQGRRGEFDKFALLKYTLKQQVISIQILPKRKDEDDLTVGLWLMVADASHDCS